MVEISYTGGTYSIHMYVFIAVGGMYMLHIRHFLVVFENIDHFIKTSFLPLSNMEHLLENAKNGSDKLRTAAGKNIDSHSFSYFSMHKRHSFHFYY